ncbi:MAG TPA: cytochrome c biogenesis protein CcsA, partial [Ktedonobacterales bacterium]|nr:cytochrome c biogenesis protein CcsA [Ktedonobacterales bacterium]
RLTTTLILWFIYAGYLMLRSYTGRSASGARAAAVLGIAGFVDVPINYFSVTWWNRLHPAATYVVDQGKSALPPAALTTFFISLTTWTLFFVLLLALVYHLERVRARLATARALLDE